MKEAKRMKQESFYQKPGKKHTSFVYVATLTLHFKMQGLEESMLLQKWYSPYILHVLFWTHLIEEKFDFSSEFFFALIVLINKVLFSNKKINLYPWFWTVPSSGQMVLKPVSSEQELNSWVLFLIVILLTSFIMLLCCRFQSTY